MRTNGINAIALVLLIGSMCVVVGGCNPFAPALDEEGLAGVDLLGNPQTIDGFFQRFRNAYELRDTTLYGRLFAPDFTFAYYDQELGQEIQWDRATELQLSYNLFQEVLQINLDWNFYVQLDSTDSTALIVRNFNLAIQTEEDRSFSGSGRARFELKKETPEGAWQATYWFDDSDF